MPNALTHYNTYNPVMSEGFQVEYMCSSGYVLLDPSNARLTCRNGQWEGPVPTCGELMVRETNMKIFDQRPVNM